MSSAKVSFGGRPRLEKVRKPRAAAEMAEPKKAHDAIRSAVSAQDEAGLPGQLLTDLEALLSGQHGLQLGIERLEAKQRVMLDSLQKDFYDLRSWLSGREFAAAASMAKSEETSSTGLRRRLSSKGIRLSTKAMARPFSEPIADCSSSLLVCAEPMKPSTRALCSVHSDEENGCSSAHQDVLRFRSVSNGRAGSPSPPTISNLDMEGKPSSDFDSLQSGATPVNKSMSAKHANSKAQDSNSQSDAKFAKQDVIKSPTAALKRAKAEAATETGSIEPRSSIESDMAPPAISSEKRKFPKLAGLAVSFGGKEQIDVIDGSVDREHSFDERPTSRSCSSVGSAETVVDHRAFTLPSSWPTCVPLRPSLSGGERDSNSRRDFSEISSLVQRAMNADIKTRHQLRSGENIFRRSFISMYSERSLNFRSRCVLDPNSYTRFFWDMTSLCVLLYDLVTIPFYLAFDVPSEGWVKVLSYITLGFWMMDMAASFRTGFYYNGDLVMNATRIARNYFKSWFVLDISFIAIDWMSLVLTVWADSSGDGVRVLRFTKISRMLRIFGVLRMARLMRVVENLGQGTISEATSMAVNIGKFVFVIMWSNHLLSCSWYAVGRMAPSDPGMCWLDLPMGQGDDDATYRTTTLAFKYVTAFHWATQVMTAGAMDIRPFNIYERQFNIFCLIFGLVVFSCMISLFSAKIMEIKVAKQDRESQMRSLRNFLRQKAIGKKMCCQIQKQVKERMSAVKMLTVNDVPALSLLSLSLRTEFRYELCRKDLLRHPFFCLWNEVDFPTLEKFCVEAVGFIVLMQSDNLFLAGWTADRAYLILQGSCVYTQEPGTALVERRLASQVHERSWICEASLWTQWTTVGTVEAAKETELLELNADGIYQVLPKHSSVIKLIAQEYAGCFHFRVMSAMPPNSDFPTDLSVPGTSSGELMYAMPNEIRVLIGMASLEAYTKARSGMFLTGPVSTKLQDEIRSGQSTLILNGEGDMERIVAVSILRLMDMQGRILVQLGCWTNGAAVASCRLPGIKQEDSELPGDAVSRLIVQNLYYFEDKVMMQGSDFDFCWATSPTYRIRTKYLRTTHNAILHQDAILHHDAPRATVNHRVMKSNKSEAWGIRMMLDQDIFVMGGEFSPFAFYTWLSPRDFDYFCSPDGEKDLKTWLSAIAPTSELMETGSSAPWGSSNGERSSALINYKRNRFSSRRDSSTQSRQGNGEVFRST